LPQGAAALRIEQVSGIRLYPQAYGGSERWIVMPSASHADQPRSDRRHASRLWVAARNVIFALDVPVR
jgi:hypothetical protein